MGTRCRIGVVNPDGTITSIYVHNDGYPEGPHGVGYKLREHYTDPVKVAALIALGALSSLGEEIGAEHDFDWGTKVSLEEKHQDPRSTWCRAYHRDNGEPAEECRPAVSPNLGAFKVQVWATDAEHAYLFEANEWREVAL